MAATSTKPEELLATHQKAWEELWGENIIELDGDDFVRRAINASLYNILSATDETWSTGPNPNPNPNPLSNLNS